jgi:protocadherin delta 1
MIQAVTPGLVMRVMMVQLMVMQLVVMQQVMMPVTSAIMLPLNVTYTMDEETEAGRVLGNVSTDAHLTQFYDSSALSQLRFFTLDGTPGDKWVTRHISVDRTTGVVTLTARPDREQLCPGQTACYGHVDVALGPAQYSGRLVRIFVIVNDVNDHAPSFPVAMEELQVSEALPVGSRLQVPEAEDADAGQFGIVRYEILPMQGADADTFDIISGDGQLASGGLSLELKKSLDREATPIVTVAIVAHDGGALANSASLVVNITLQDANDNAPIFSSAKHTLALPEDTSVGTTLHHLLVTENDIGLNGHVTLVFDKTTNQLYGHMFALNPSTGQLSLLQPLDYETWPRYELVVKATDGGSNPLVSFAHVFINVTDVNDNVPHITANTLRDDGVAVIVENSGSAAFVAYMSVSDEDNEENGNVTCSLTPHHHFELVAQSPGQYKVLTTHDLDRETRDSYIIVISCHDNGTPPHETNATLNVIVLDTNDNSPHFSHLAPVFYLPEDAAVGSEVGRVTAIDEDEGDNGRVIYRTPDTVPGLLIDWQTGIIRTSDKLDYESANSVELVVEAVDQGLLSRTSAVPVRVIVLDVNDEKPIFVQQTYTFVVAEDVSAGSTVGRVQAIDRDSPPHNDVTYTILHVTPSRGELLFSVDSEGTVSTTDTLDRETQNVYTVTVQATDTHVTTFLSVATVNVYVSDVNDHTPIIHFPNDVNTSVAISSHVPVNTVVAQIVATDADTGDNAFLHYYVTIQNDSHTMEDTTLVSHLFRCDLLTGDVIVNADLANIKYAVVNLTIVVSDGAGSGASNTTGHLTVIVNSSLDVAQTSREVGRWSLPLTASQANTIAVLAVASASCVIICILLTAIVVVVCSGRRREDGARCSMHYLLTLACHSGLVKHNHLLYTSSHVGCKSANKVHDTQSTTHHLPFAVSGVIPATRTLATASKTALNAGRSTHAYHEKRVSFRDSSDTVSVHTSH